MIRCNCLDSLPKSHRINFLIAAVICAIVATMGCNRAEVRIHGASTDFPQELSGYRAKKSYSEKIIIAVPVDKRPNYYGVKVAESTWEGCKTDSFFGDQARYVIRDRVAKELAESKLFENISDALEPKDHELVLHTEIHAFCSQAKGFLIVRVAGIVALEFTLMKDNQILYTKKIEKVVTDADPEYSGSQVSFIEQAMRRTMADSLRVVMKTVMSDMDDRMQTKLKNTK